jgi:ribonuclease HI
MSVSAPHFLLLSEAAVPAGELAGAGASSGRWRFELRTPDGEPCLEVADDEPAASTERLQLLAIVRGLEALDEPSRVTLVAAGRSISRSLRYGLAQWRENDWHWERYGKLTPVKNGDLWRRIDRAMAIHQIECRDASSATDDLAAPPDPVHEPADVRIIRHRGRRLRIDSPGGQSEIRNPKHERNPNREFSKDVRSRRGVRLWCLRILNFFRISDFVLRIFAAR